MKLIFNCMFCLTLSQLRDSSAGVICEYLGVQVTALSNTNPNLLSLACQILNRLRRVHTSQNQISIMQPFGLDET